MTNESLPTPSDAFHTPSPRPLDPLATFLSDVPNPAPDPSSASELSDQSQTDERVSTAAALPTSAITQLESLKQYLSHAVVTLEEILHSSGTSPLAVSKPPHPVIVSSHLEVAAPPLASIPSDRIVEGIFDGANMNGFDGREYSMPPNYASKSKLVEGDHMKLTITQEGIFIYKQIKPIERKRVLVTLEQEESTRDYYVSSSEGRWRVLTASITYYKGFPDDEVVVLVPRYGESAWAAVENIIKKV